MKVSDGTAGSARPEVLAYRTALGSFGVCLGIAAWILGNGPAGWLYLVLYALAVLPGFPLGFALFGKEHAGGWIAGVLIGYALMAFAIWAPIAAHVPSALAFVLVWAAAGAVTWYLAPRSAVPLVMLPRWTPSASAALLLVLVLTIGVAAPPLANVGRTDSAGNRYYRAYFTADFVWHTALTAEIAKFSMPPRNPYIAHRPIHYYWAYFLLPAAISETGPPALRDVERCLKLNALATGLLLMSSVFLAAWAVVGKAVPVAAATALALVASSAEGLYALYRLWSRGAPLSGVRNLNIDAITAWWFEGHRIDGLQRCLWYVPQHSMAYALGLIAIAVAATAGSRATKRAIVLTGIVLGCAVSFNPFVGGVFALAYGIVVVIDALRRPAAIATIATHGLAAVPVVAAVGWCAANRMVEGAGGALEFGLRGASRQAPLLTLTLSLGPVLGFVIAGGIAGLWPRASNQDETAAAGSVLPSFVVVALALLLLYFVRLSVDVSWVGFRAGQMILVAVPALIARFLARGWYGGRRSLTAAVFVAALAAGLPTLAIDEYNARDIHNFAMSTTFPWTIVVSPDEVSAFKWIREHTPETAIVQMDPTVRQRSTWSNIPSFAQRRMAAGLPISLLDQPEYHERSDQVRIMYDIPDASEAWRIAHALRIDYIYLDSVELAAHPAATKFAGSPQYFEPVFQQGAAGVYRVR